MISNKPYLMRAFYQWIVDSNCNPLIVVDATHPRCKVPTDYIENGEIVFNVSPTAVRELKLLNDKVEFQASFSGVIHFIHIPISAILSVYAEENGEGIFFDQEEDENPVEPEPVSHLRGVNTSVNMEMNEQHVEVKTPIRAKPFLKLVESNRSE